MTELVATTPGLYPLPDGAREALGRLKGHQMHDMVSGDEGPEVTSVYDEAREAVIGTQVAAGLDRVVEGQLRWDDMLAHPLCVHDAVETRGLERYYDNNNFYREPVVVDDLDADGDLAADLRAAEAALDGRAPLQAVAPGPYSLFDLATDEHYGDGAAFLDGLSGFLSAEVSAFPAAETCFLLEPSLVTEPPEGDTLERAVDAVARVADATDADVVVHTYWGALDAAVHAALLDAGVDGLGYDLVTAPEASLDLLAEHGTGRRAALGLVDGQNTRVETAASIREDVERIRERAPAEPEAIYVTSNTELFYLPVNKFEAKLAALGEAVRPEAVTA